MLSQLYLEFNKRREYAQQLPKNALDIYIFAARSALDTLSNEALECALSSSIPLTTAL